jgi:hypothetical protein
MKVVVPTFYHQHNYFWVFVSEHWPLWGGGGLRISSSPKGFGGIGFPERPAHSETPTNFFLEIRTTSN